MKGLTIILLIFFACTGLQCGAQTKIFKAAKIHQGNGATLENAFLVIDDSRIAYVGEQLLPKYQGIAVEDLGNQRIYPGVIALNTQLGLNEIDAVRATRDYREVGKYNPNVRAVIAYNTDSEVVKTVRSNGVLIAQICPVGGRISGQSSAVRLQAWNWEDAAVRMEDGIHLYWPKKYQKRGWWADLKPDKKLDTYEKELTELEHHFGQAKAYMQKEPKEQLQKFEALAQVLDQKIALYIHLDGAEAMLDAIHFCEQWDIEPIFYGASEAWKILPMLKKQKVKIVLKGTQRLPSQIDGGIRDPYGLGKLFYDHGIDFAIAYKGSWEQRNLVFQAAEAVAYGLDYDEGIKAITLMPAEIMGIAQERGSLEAGKYADFIVCKGDLLEIGESVIHQAFIQGERIDLQDKQKVLYEKYMNKYELEE